MAISSGFNRLLINISSFLIVALIAVSSSGVEASGNYFQDQLSWMTPAAACRGTIAECMADGEFEMDSEVTRRILAGNTYISYGALQRNNVPCSKRGSSYYNNCQKGGQANPYTRGCSAITRCRTGV